MKDHQWKPQRLAIASVRERAELQMRHGALDLRHVKELARAMADGRDVPPIKVARLGKALCVVDGFHRLAAAKSLDLEAIEALVVRMDLREARAFARGANEGHGKRTTARDKRKAFASYIEDGAHLDAHGNLKSGRTIASEKCGGYSHTRVYALLRQHGIEPDYALEEAEGSRWGGGYSHDDGGEDIDDINDEAEGPLDADGAAEALGHLAAIGPIYFGLGERRRLETLGAVRALLERLEANVDPEAPEEARLDI